MSLPIHVDMFKGDESNPWPQEFVFDEEIYEIAEVIDRWFDAATEYFKVQSTEGKTYLLRYDGEADEWTLQSGFDGDELLARGRTSNSLPLILRRRRKQKSKSNHVSTAILTMRRFLSIGCWPKRQENTVSMSSF